MDSVRAKTKISFIIPVFNEAETLAVLYEDIAQSMSKESVTSFEVIFIDDGSRDASWEQITQIARKHPKHIRAIKFRRNFGKAQALSTGFSLSRGDLIFTLDADLQDDPAEIPKFIRKIDEGFDLVSGWKMKRHDPFSKTIPSKIFNRVVRMVSGVKLHDFNCGFKAFRREVLGSLQIYGELHRYIPVLAHNQGFRVGEVGVVHHPRKFGKSKYGWERYSRGFLDLLTVMLTTKYLQRPGHLFGGMGILFGSVGFLSLVYLSVLWFLHLGPIGTRPLLSFGVMMMIMAVQFISLGLIAELLVHSSRKQSDDSVFVQERIGELEAEGSDIRKN